MQESSSPAEIPSQPGQFRLDSVLTMVSGVVFTGADREHPVNYREITDMARYLTGDDSVELPQVPRVSEEVTASIIKKYPLLEEILRDIPEEVSPDASSDEKDANGRLVKTWYDNTMEKYGDWMGDPILLQPIDPNDHTIIPVQDELDMGYERRLDEQVQTLGEPLDAVQTVEDLPFHVSGSPTAHTTEQSEQIQDDAGTNRISKDMPAAPAAFDDEAAQREIDNNTTSWQRNQQRPLPPDTEAQE